MTTTIIPARERAQAPIGCAYVAPLFWNKWFRWDGSRASGCYQLNHLFQNVGATYAHPVGASARLDAGV